jgi:hypothetical protein
VEGRYCLAIDHEIIKSMFCRWERGHRAEQCIVALKTEMQAFPDVNIAWLTRMLAAASVSGSKCETKAGAIFAAVAGAQLMARSRADLSLFDALITGFSESGLIPT